MIESSKYPTWHVSIKQRNRARRLRQRQTDAERMIWSALRAHRMNGASVRRQVPVGPHIADFLCHSANLIVEIDGGQHFAAGALKYDARRDAFFASKGYRVLRFSNHDVIRNRQGVLETIAAAIAVAPSPPLPRKRGREQSEQAARP